MRFAPIDWLYTRPHGRLIGRGSEAEVIGALSNFMRIGEPMALGMSLLRYGSDREDRKLYEDVYAKHEFDQLRWEVLFSDAMVKFATRGRNIYSITPNALQNIEKIDPSGITGANLKMPAKSFYLAWDDPFTTLPDGRQIDGVLVFEVLGPPKATSNADPAFLHAIMEKLEALDPMLLEQNPEAMLTKLLADEYPARLLNITLVPVPDTGDWTQRREMGKMYQIDLENDVSVLHSLENNQDLSPELVELPFYTPMDGETAIFRKILATIEYISRSPDNWQLAYTRGDPDLIKAANGGRKAAIRELIRQGYLPSLQVT